MPAPPPTTLETLSRLYAEAGFAMVADGVPLGTAPPFGGGLLVGWTDSDFAAPRWRERDPNPAGATDEVSFERFRDHHAWTARFWIWALEKADTAAVANQVGIATGSSARTRLSLFAALVRHAEDMGKKRILDLTQDDLRTIMKRLCGLHAGGSPVARTTAADRALVLARTHHLGPAGGHWVPDGLSFDPGPVLADIVSHPDLLERQIPVELDEGSVRQLANTAARWVEELGAPLAELRGLLDDFDRWTAGRGIKASSASAGPLVHEYIAEKPEALEAYERLSTAFPAPLDTYDRCYRFSGADAENQRALNAIDALKLEELEAIAAAPDVERHRRSFSADAAARRLGCGPARFYKRPMLRAAADAARKEIEAALAARGGERRPEGRPPRAPAGAGLAGAASGNPSLESFRRLRAQTRGLTIVMTGLCYVVLDVFGGWRISEILSVDARDLERTALGPELGSKVRKTSASPTAVTHRPVTPLVARAIELLVEMNSSHFTEEDRRVFRTSRGTPCDRASVHDAIRRASGEAGIEEAPNSHQFRHFFAHFWLRRFKGGDDALRRHFRHVTRGMVRAYTSGALNAAHLAKAEEKLALEIAEGIVLGKRYSSRYAAHDTRARYRALNLPPEQAERWVRTELEGKYRSVHPTPFGYCMFQRGDTGAACDAKTGPVLARAEPFTCGGCKFLASGDENIGFWQTTALLHQEIVASEHHVPILKRESRRMLRVCEGVLARHGLVDGPEGRMDGAAA